MTYTPAGYIIFIRIPELIFSPAAETPRENFSCTSLADEIFPLQGAAQRRDGTYNQENYFMKIEKIYRRRIIPEECILLKDDIIIAQDEETLITTWNTLHPKASFSHGCSCFFLKEGIKVSKLYRSDNTLLHWYCDIVDYSCDQEGVLTYTDLLADVVVHPDGSAKVLDLDELAEAVERGLITKEQTTRCLNSLHHLLGLVYREKFDRLQAPLEKLGL